MIKRHKLVNGLIYGVTRTDEHELFTGETIVVLAADYDKALDHFGIEHRTLAARNDHLVNILTAIHSLLPPENVKAEDGREYEFNDPNAMTHLRELRRLIRAIPDKLAAASTANPSGKQP